MKIPNWNLSFGDSWLFLEIEEFLDTDPSFRWLSGDIFNARTFPS